jgi:hypothetical protein
MLPTTPEDNRVFRAVTHSVPDNATLDSYKYDRQYSIERSESGLLECVEVVEGSVSETVVELMPALFYVH